MDLRFFIYNIPFSGGFRTANSEFNTRKGIIVRLKKDGITALGEAAPLPGFSNENLGMLKNQIQQHRSKFHQFFKTDFTQSHLNSLLKTFTLVPSLQYGLFTVTIIYLAQKNCKSLHHFLFGSNYNNQPKLNAVIDLSTRDVLAQTQQYVDQGFETIKLKTDNHWEATFSQIKKIRSKFNNLLIRLDANRSWQLSKAKKYLKQAEELKIEYCEEPLANKTKQNLQKLKQATKIPIALDETMTRWPDIEEIALAADIFILKPMVIGRYAKIREILNFARKNNKQLVFTSSLGTAVERLATATMAAGFGSPGFGHGLNTGSLLSSDLWDDARAIENGSYILPDYTHLKKRMENNLQNLPIKPL